MPLRVMVVDDHEGFRAVARALLSSAGYDVVAEAVDGADALARATLLAPELVLLDVQLPDVDGLEVSRRLAVLTPAPTVVLTSSRPLRDLRHRIEDCPVAGFLPKQDLSAAALAAMWGAP